jgi:two-component system, chemotaxis family, protein-glutamate methylesterase/glutaminase
LRLRSFRPNADWLLESAAASFRERAVGIILSGLLHDGTRGSMAVKAAGGVMIAQDPATCERPEMPSTAIAIGAIDHILSADQIGPRANTLLVPD